MNIISNTSTINIIIISIKDFCVFNKCFELENRYFDFFL